MSVSGSSKSSLALHQRPAVPGVRSAFGTMTELNNSVPLLFSRCEQSATGRYV